jgi:hypothetical protein
MRDMVDLSLEHKKLAKYMFILNALEDGWTVKKRDEKYIFSKHKGKEKEVYLDNYVELFVKKYMIGGVNF